MKNGGVAIHSHHQFIIILLLSIFQYFQQQLKRQSLLEYLRQQTLEDRELYIQCDGR